MPRVSFHFQAESVFLHRTQMNKPTGVTRRQFLHQEEALESRFFVAAGVEAITARSQLYQRITRGMRKRNNLLMSELAHMKKLYNDIIYFVQNHVKPVTPSNSYSPSMLLYGPPSAPPPTTNSSLLQKPSNQLLGHYPNSPMPRVQVLNSPTATSQNSLTILEEQCSNSRKTKLFGVPLQSKKRLHPEYGATNMETSKARLVLEKDDLRLNLMPPTC
ncbi:hypothetical protein HRI_004036800 [Hibiscus trionum]|uniref:Uncharacterized protein n=1 Tax=Hibiscus trionum TaxID=183268 RepID=A0A9W7IXH1_HIBTR|nr:hypothetical protein HRI_004036800 [Hibiscus trionum]